MLHTFIAAVKKMQIFTVQLLCLAPEEKSKSTRIQGLIEGG